VDSFLWLIFFAGALMIGWLFWSSQDAWRDDHRDDMRRRLGDIRDKAEQAARDAHNAAMNASNAVQYVQNVIRESRATGAWSAEGDWQRDVVSALHAARQAIRAAESAQQAAEDAASAANPFWT